MKTVSRDCSQPPDKPKLVQYAMKLDLINLARLAGLRAVRYKIVGIQLFAQYWNEIKTGTE